MPTNVRDPRTVITPDAFEIDRRLLGTPLAPPWRRFWAMLVDLVVIGALTVLFDSVQLFVWGVVGLFLLRMAFQRQGPGRQAFAVVLRLFAGCLGVTVVTVVVLVFAVAHLSTERDEELGPAIGPLMAEAGVTDPESRPGDDQESGDFVSLLRDIWDQAGSAIGLWSIYFTVLLTLTNGQTAGKRLLGLRVLRLDGQPITWWSAFERAGGYVAGIATGTLGFVQLFWDPNRQCIHDKIVGTVVVERGAVPDPVAWREAHGMETTKGGTG